MRVVNKQNTRLENYCCVHNVDCPYEGDMVLLVNPGYIPKSWMCPEAVMEISQLEDEMEQYL